MTNFPTHRFIAYQTIGAFLVLAGYYLMIGWPQFKKVIASAVHQAPIDDDHEWIPYRLAFWGIPISILGMALWCWLMGMSLWLAIVQIALFMLVMTVVMARSTAEAGLLMTTLTFRPMDIVRLFVPLQAMGAANLTVTSFLDPIFFRDQRGLVLTALMDGMKISDGVGMRRRSLLLIFGIAILTAYLAASIIQIYLSYHRGAMTMYPYLTMDNPTMAFRSYTPALTGQVPFEATNIGFTIAGIITTLILITMRLNCFWWPLHPLGYALSSSWSLWVFWFPCLIAWAAKGLITHYGGMRFYLKARPFFLGLILGEFTLALFWTLITSITPCSAPEFPWP
jgi:hypothetical protein